MSILIVHKKLARRVDLSRLSFYGKWKELQQIVDSLGMQLETAKGEKGALWFAIEPDPDTRMDEIKGWDS